MFETVRARKLLEYCFSILHKDVFLRTQMDTGGFVDLAALLRFGLIAALAARGRRRRARRRRASRVLETTAVTDACRVRLRVLLGARRSTAAALGWRVSNRKT